MRAVVSDLPGGSDRIGSRGGRGSFAQAYRAHNQLVFLWSTVGELCLAGGQPTRPASAGRPGHRRRGSGLDGAVWLEAIRGHGIPEVMLSILKNQSRIPPQVGVLKPISTAIAIGTGCPFGAEGPIIVTGGAIGSLVGQILSTTAEERKILLSAGAAAGMSATFGSPVSGVLLAVELLLFEFRPRSLVPVAVASATAAALRKLTSAPWPMFPMQQLQTSGMTALDVVHLDRRDSGLGLGRCDSRRIRSRGCVRAIADPLDVVACDGRHCCRHRWLRAARDYGCRLR